MTRFTEFYNKQKNIIKSSIAKRLESSIPISEERDAFYKGELFKKYDIVESEGKQYTILEQASNYYHVVDSEGNLSRKFAKQLTKISHTNIAIVNNKFHGYEIVSEEAQQYLKEHYNESADDVGILKQVKQLDEQMDSSYKAKDKMTVAKIIADAVGVPHDMVSTPENLVAAAIRKAKKDPKLVKNKEILANMLQIAREVGIKISDDSFDIKESEQLDEISDTKKIEYIHAARKSIKKLDSEGNTEKRDQRSVTANRTYSTISKDVKKKAFGDMRESEELDESAAAMIAAGAALAKANRHGASKPKTPNAPDYSHVMGSYRRGKEDAKAGKPYNNPFEMKKELGAVGNYDHNSYREGYHSKNESEEFDESFKYDVDHMPGAVRHDLGNARKIEADREKRREYEKKHVKTFIATREKDAKEFADKHGHKVVKHEYPAGHKNMYNYEWHIVKESEQLDETFEVKEATDWSPGTKETIKKDKIQSLRNLIASYQSKKNFKKVAELQKELDGLLKESVELEEGGLSRKTIDSYLEKAKASKPGTIHKAIKRFAGQERAQDRVHKDELEKMKTRLSLKEMRTKLQEEMGTAQKVDKANDTPDADIEAKPHEMPHGHTLNPSNEIHRKQLIRKVRGDD